MRYIEMHRGPHTYWARLFQEAEISNLKEESMCPCENMAYYMEYLLGLASECR